MNNTSLFRQLICLLMLLVATPELLTAQTMGNYNNQRPGRVTNTAVRYRAVPRPAAFTTDPNVVELTVSALSNQAATSQVAIFSVFQSGKTVKAVNDGMNQRLNAVRAGLRALGVGEEDFHVDLVNFLPTYAYASEKKIFSRNTLTEVPTGFNLQKNIHVRYRDPELLDRILTVAAASEIYDIIKLDYSVPDPQRIYTELREQTFRYLDTLVGQYAARGVALDTARWQVAENAWVVYPGDRYESYVAHSSQQLTAQEKASAVVTKADKPTLRFYDAIPTNDYDLVINPGLLEPAAQFSYSLKVRFVLAPKKEVKPVVQTKVQKQFYYMTADGKVVPLVIE